MIVIDECKTSLIPYFAKMFADWRAKQIDLCINVIDRAFSDTKYSQLQSAVD
jgi:hypothetical protein